MTMAAAHGMQSIAMPLIGHGLAGWPAKLAAQIHAEQVVQFFKASTAACSVKVLGKSYACVLIFSSGHAAQLSKVPTCTALNLKLIPWLRY
jgi:O-acetyl-ADP-ribose deacetylase (regulator of RNase III)